MGSGATTCFLRTLTDGGLRRWACGDEVKRPFAEWLIEEPEPDRLHAVALGWDWDAGLEAMR